MGPLRGFAVFFCILCWVAGLGLMTFGGIMLTIFRRDLVGIHGSFIYIPKVIIGIGAILFLFTFLGFGGALKKDTGVLYTFSFFLGVIFFWGVITGIVALTMNKETNEVVTQTLKDTIYDYQILKNKGVIDVWQRTFWCCGIDAPADYDTQTLDHQKGNLRPYGCGIAKGVKSCHKEWTCASELYQKGCKLKLNDFIEGQLTLLAGVIIGTVFLPVLTMGFSLLLAQGVADGYRAV